MDCTIRNSILSAGFAAGFLIYIAVCPLQAQQGLGGADPLSMPADRVSDSFQIYSSLIPLGETANPRWSHEKWLVADSTVTVVPDDEPCSPAIDPERAKKFSPSMNPHLAVHFPEKYREDGEEILADFDAHCHERWNLDGGSWSVSEPLLLLSGKEQNEFKLIRFRVDTEGKFSPETIAKYKGAVAIYSFSGAYFNRNHTVALVHATHWCGSLCGEGFWTGFVLEDGVWKRQAWGGTMWIS